MHYALCIMHYALSHRPLAISHKPFSPPPAANIALENSPQIIYWGGFELPDKNAAAHRVMANAKLLRQFGYEVVFLGMSSETFTGVRKASETVYEESHPCTNRQWAEHLVSLRNLREVIGQCSNLKAIILYNLPFITLLRVRLAFRSFKVIYDCTEWTPVTEGSLLKRLFKRLDGFAVRHWLPSMTDALIVISKRMEQAYASRSTVLRLPPLIDADDAIWRQAPHHSDTFDFVYAGVLDNSKDSLDTIVSAFHSLPFTHVRLRVIGITQDDFLNYYPHFKSSSAMADDRILFMGRLSHEETVRHVLSCGCYIFFRPSDLRNNAGFPTKFVEAFTCGVPIIATDISDIRNYNRSNIRIIASPDEHALIEAMTAAVKDGQHMPSIDMTFHYANYRQSMGDWLGLFI